MLRTAAAAAARGARSPRLVDSHTTVRRMMATGKDLRFATEARDLMARGVNALADAVSVTLGPRGRNVVIEKSYGGPQITKDGVTVARNIEFADKHMNVGAQLVRSVAKDTNDIAGDGTTTATVLTRAIYTEGIKAVAAGMNPMDLKRGIDLAVEKVLAALKEMTQAIHSKEEISSVRLVGGAVDPVGGGRADGRAPRAAVQPPRFPVGWGGAAPCTPHAAVATVADAAAAAVGVAAAIVRRSRVPGAGGRSRKDDTYILSEVLHACRSLFQCHSYSDSTRAARLVCPTRRGALVWASTRPPMGPTDLGRCRSS